MRVVVFGPAREIPGFTPFARHVGNLIGTNGHALATGGCPGPVREVALAALESGCSDIHTVSHVLFFAHDRPDQHACHGHVEVARTLALRVERLINGIELAVAFAGGPGTICELEHVLVDAPSVPVVLVGSDWGRLGSVTEALLYERLDQRCNYNYKWFVAEDEHYLAPVPIDDLLRA